MMLNEEIMDTFLAYCNGVNAEADKKVAAAEAKIKADVKKIKKLERQAQKAEKQRTETMKGLLRNNVPPKVIATSFHIPLKQVLQIQAALTP